MTYSLYHQALYLRRQALLPFHLQSPEAGSSYSFTPEAEYVPSKTVSHLSMLLIIFKLGPIHVPPGLAEPPWGRSLVEYNSERVSIAGLLLRANGTTLNGILEIIESARGKINYD